MPRFQAHEHLRKPAEFQAVYDRRRSAADTVMIIYAKENGLPHSRLGLSVSKKFGNAVRRNRIRRLMRESYRLVKEHLPAGYDLVLIPRPLPEYTLAEFKKSLVKQAKHAIKKIVRDAETKPPEPPPCAETPSPA